MNILDFIPTGKENAISKENLCKLTGIKDERIIRDAIKRQVESGVPILSSSGHKGYWYSEDLEEIKEFIRENDHRSNALNRTTAKLKKEKTVSSAYRKSYLKKKKKDKLHSKETCT